MVDKDFLNDLEEQQAINEIVELGFANRKNPKIWLRNLAVAMAILVIGIPAFAYTFPALAQHIPIIGGIFERRGGRFADIAEFADVIGMEVTSHGVTVAIEDAVFDGSRVYFTYVIVGITHHFIVWPEVTFALIVNGEYVETDSHAEIERNWGESDIFIGTGQIDSLERLDPDANVEVVMNFTAFNTFVPDIYEIYPLASGYWDFRFPIEIIEHEVITVNQTTYSEGFELTIYDIMLSPISTRIYYSAILPNGNYYHSVGDSISLFRIRDNFGHIYNLHTGWCSSRFDGRYFSGCDVVNGINPEASYLIINPVGQINNWEQAVNEDGSLAYSPYSGQPIWQLVDFERVVLPEIIIELP